MKLPEPRLTSNISLEQTIQSRRSIRIYQEGSLTIEEVSQLLWAAQGKTAEWGGRTAPSAGASFPLEIYLVAGDVSGLETGVYHYLWESHELAKLSGYDKRKELTTVSWGQKYISLAPIDIVIAADYKRTTARYGNIGSHYVDLEVGHCGQNIQLQAEALGLGSVVIGAFQENLVMNSLGIKEDPVYIIPVGRKKV